jgi:nucleotide-binding universal stress UspA family protein
MEEAMRPILVATDGSDGAERAVDYAANLARVFKADLMIVNVKGGYDLPEEIFRRFTSEQSAWWDEALTALSAGVLERARDRARALGITAIRLASRSGDVAQAIIEFADETDAGAIVVGKRGEGRVAGILLGSVSQKLVSLATRVVIAVP